MERKIGEIQKSKIEKKEFVTVPFECKALPEKEDDNYFYFEGYLSTYGNIDRVDDVMVKGCFDESLKELDPDLLWMHMYGEILGIFEDIKSDSKGLFVRGKMPKTDTLVSGRAIPQMKVGSVRSMSIGYWAQEFEYDEDGIRHIHKCRLYEGSLVSQPANEKAEITDMKAFEIDEVKQVKTRRDMEDMLRDSRGFSRKSAVYLASLFTPEEPSESDESKAMKALVEGLESFTETINSMR
jgi:HK97 family phage prohead protease